MKKHKIIIFLLSILFLIIEILNFKNLYNLETYIDLRSSFWIFHFIFSIIFIGIFYFLLKEDIGYYDVFIIFFPILGIFIMILSEIFDLKKEIENPIEEVYSINEYKQKKEEDEFINFYADLNTLSAYDFLLLEDSKIKKKFLFEFNSPDVNFKVEIFQKALLDKDVEVIHYAAIELNKIDVKLQENIKIAEETKNLYKIYNAYKEYINSGLLCEDILTFYQKKALNILLKIIEFDKNMNIELLDIYYKMKNKKEYENLLKILLEENSSKELLERFLKFLYDENRFREMMEIYKKYNMLEIKLPALFDEFNNYNCEEK